MSKIPKLDYVYGQTEGSPNVNAKVYVKIFDAVTNQLTNGNNILVFYSQTLLHTTTYHNVTVPGQSVLIYNGPLLGDAQHARWEITNWDEPDEPVVPENECDLVISLVNIVKPESAPGAADGQISVVASSSFGPIEYSLDGSNWQTSNVFSGLIAGPKTAHARDTNPRGCNKTYSIDLPVITDLLIGTPAITLPNGNVSRWSATFNPVNFEYQRKDFGVIKVEGYSIVNAGTKARVFINALTAGVQIGDSVYLNAGPYKGVYQVLQLGSANTLILNTPFVGNGAGFININSLRPYYAVLTRITFIDPVTGNFDTIVSRNRPNNTGYIKADISSFLQSLLRAKDQSDYTQVNYRDMNLSASYRIEYAEEYKGHTPEYSQLDETYYVIFAAKQLGDRHGGNLADFVTFPVNSAAKWITDFKEPVYCNNFPWDIGFLYGETIAESNRQLYYQLVMLDINRQPLNINTITTFLLNEDGTYILNSDSSKFVIARQDLFDTPIVERVGLNRLMIDIDFPERAYYFNIGLYYKDDDDNPVQVSATQTVRIDKEIKLQSVYLRWIGLNGSWNYYRFYYSQEVSLDVSNAVIINNFVTDWANADTIEDVISKNANQKMKLVTEDTSVNDIKGLQSIKYSPKVQLLVNSNPIRWQTVIVNTSSFNEYDTRRGQAPFSITINLPGINTQTQ